jgi:histidinol-phosphatase (PHP family)
VIDLHTHHERCGHALGTLEDYVRAALRRGLSTVGLSDHAPLLLEDASGEGVVDEPAPGMHMPASAFDGYLAEASGLRSRFAGRLEVLVGVEADYLAGREAAYAELLSDRRLDYALGAVHYVDGRHVYDRSRWRGGSAASDVDALYARYLELVREAAATGSFDVLAHIDAIKAYAPRPPRAPEREWDTTVEALLHADVAVEINTSGVRKCGEPFPAWGLIERLHEAGVPLTFGSDAHTPDEVHFDFDAIRRGLLERGIDTLIVLRQRVRCSVPIGGAPP